MVLRISTTATVAAIATLSLGGCATQSASHGPAPRIVAASAAPGQVNAYTGEAVRDARSRSAAVNRSGDTDAGPLGAGDALGQAVFDRYTQNRPRPAESMKTRSADESSDSPTFEPNAPSPSPNADQSDPVLRYLRRLNQQHDPGRRYLGRLLIAAAES